MQLSTEPVMRGGRVMALRLAIALGGIPIGAPIIGWSLTGSAAAVGATAGFAAAVVALCYLVKYRNLRLRIEAGRLRFNIDDPMTDST